MTSRRLLTPEAKALLDAADYIDAHGHHKRGYYPCDYKAGMTPPACAIGAILRVSQNDTVWLAVKKLAAAIGTDDIPRWNDAPQRTPVEVAAALRSAAVSTSNCRP